MSRYCLGDYSRSLAILTSPGPFLQLSLSFDSNVVCAIPGQVGRVRKTLMGPCPAPGSGFKGGVACVHSAEVCLPHEGGYVLPLI